MLYPAPLERLINDLARLPGVGRKTATRLAFFLLNAKGELVENLARSLLEIREKIRLCGTCFNITDRDPCAICSDPRREKSTICVVEEPSHMLVIEAAFPGAYRYHVLHGVLNPIEGVGPEEIRLGEMVSRIEKEGITEVIVATNPTMEGNTTAHYIADLLEGRGVRITRIASGIPVGGDLVYSDPLTLKSSLDNRRNL